MQQLLDGGWTTQSDVGTTNAESSTSIELSILNPNGSTSIVMTTNV